MKYKSSLLFLFFLLLNISAAVAQSYGYITGTVKDEKGKPVPFINISLMEYPDQGTYSTEAGNYFLRVPANERLSLTFTYIGYEPIRQQIRLLPGDTLELDFTVKIGINLIPTIIVEDKTRDKPSTFKLDPKAIEQIPVPSGNFEAILKTIGLGVSTAGGELSSQYSVRGGNFDENLVYVNDFEIYRPLLVRSGQQEGLSFINPDLVRNVLFSSGGFEAKYGDKMSSVLDVQYKEPDSFKASVSLSLLGGGFHIEGTAGSRWSYLAGVRQKSNQYLLSSLNTEGDYQPSFTDVQALIGYKINPNWKLELISNYARNRYRFVPQSRVTSIGTVNNVKQLEVFFDGQEVDAFETVFGGLSATYAGDSNRLRLKFMTSAYRALETETFDIIGDFFLYQVESNLGESNFGEKLFGLGYGTFQDFTRNYLEATVANAEHKGFYFVNENHFLEWGLKYQFEDIEDNINEWERMDSALYSLPYDAEQVLIRSKLQTQINLTSSRYSGYLQDTWIIRSDSVKDINLTGGLRFHYWDVNKEFLMSPRAQFSIKPDWEKNIILRAAAGLYQQVPFYRELRNMEGELNLDLKSQKSFHFVFGGDYVFDAWNREFRLISEIYYKQLWDLVPYEIEDVKIRYFGENLAKGYAAGIDFRLHGEFVEDAESWINVSLMKTQEDIEGDFYIDTAGVRQEIGYLDRPTDQRLNVGILFQDYLPRNKNFKMHLNFLVGTGLPFGPPNSMRFRNALRIPPYRRVDIGFSALIYDENRRVPAKTFIRHFESIWASLEVFNLLQIDNTISHIWLKDNQNILYAFENHLTSRRINLRFVVKI